MEDEGLRYDFDLIQQRCGELGFAFERSDLQFVVDLGRERLVFVNADEDRDCRMGFDSTGWHSHGHIQFSGATGQCVELNYLDVLSGLADGSALICEWLRDGQLHERSLVHRDYFDELRFLRPGDEIRVWRATRHDI